MYIQTVALRDVKCHALHGYYPEEQLIGCYFVIDVEVKFNANSETENLDKTVNYEVLNQIIIDEMAKTQKLLETVVMNILNAVRSNYPFLISGTVGIKKLNPPMQGEIGHSYVALSFNV